MSWRSPNVGSWISWLVLKKIRDNFVRTHGKNSLSCCIFTFWNKCICKLFQFAFNVTTTIFLCFNHIIANWVIVVVIVQLFSNALQWDLVRTKLVVLLCTPKTCPLVQAEEYVVLFRKRVGAMRVLRGDARTTVDPTGRRTRVFLIGEATICEFDARQL